ncbi:MAG TPA: SUMF1/EgtB/PvdO family nonheme iron enzyme [Solirubrobacteraceae bacterium]|jgi:iron(II)-dependent oxidoreductase|nr:SUMF1/EgtB/PvdO family nonheme iron enzyme [Solirubrobacteraceae bacterium]
MALSIPQDHAPASDSLVAATLDDLSEVRRATLALVAHLDDATLQRPLSPIMSPLVWDLAHIAAYEDLWLAHRHAGLPLLRPELAELYDAFETPRAVRGEVELLDAPAARAYLRAVRERVVDALAGTGVGDGVLGELVLRHELQHTETMRQTMALAGILPAGEPPAASIPTAAIDVASWIEIPAEDFMMGAPSEGFAYDNERPRHAVALGAFRIARHPVANASWLSFSEGGGYERREWWSDEGWAWKEEYDITHHPAVATGDPRAPVCHVSWFEADAFARAHRARLPSEAEWERAATSDQLEGTGYVWEWTRSRFDGYPGFVAYPYREYSEVFFGGDYFVLRGGSWAASPRVASATFRNWDHPQRRQIFAGLRLAQDVSQ